MKITLNRIKPRNPLVALARFRKAGGHRLHSGSQRQESGRTLRREIDRMKHSP